jgi:tRNA(His) 5'-end guanylyltransferase
LTIVRFLAHCLTSAHPEIDAFVKTRHPEAWRNLDKSMGYWIPACAGNQMEVARRLSFVETASDQTWT